MLVLEEGMELLERIDLGDRVGAHAPLIRGMNDFGRYDAPAAISGRRRRRRSSRRS